MNHPTRASAARVPDPSGDRGAVLPWWRLPIVWLVLGGPAVVVVAALTTAVIAYRTADVVLDTAPASAGSASDGAAEPALRARNHAATPR